MERKFNMNKTKKALVLWLFLGLFLGIFGSVKAQTSCTVQSQAQLLQAFSDNAPTKSITPQVLRNLVCSTFSASGFAPSAFIAWFFSLPTTPVNGSPTFWNNGGMLSYS